MERLLCDMDGCITDTMGAMMDVAYRERGLMMCHDDIKDYWFAGLPVEAEYFADILRRPGFYRELEPITGAIRAIRRLRREYDVVVCTSPMSGVEESCEQEKREWLDKHFDLKFAASAIVTRDKTKVDGKVLIEDNPDVSQNANWKVIMFTQPWNARFNCTNRMYGWGDLGIVRSLMNE